MFSCNQLIILITSSFKYGILKEYNLIPIFVDGIKSKDSDLIRIILELLELLLDLDKENQSS